MHLRALFKIAVMALACSVPVRALAQDAESRPSIKNNKRCTAVGSGDAADQIALAEKLAGSQRYPEAIQTYREALLIQPGSEIAAVGLANAYRKVLNEEEARVTLKKARVRNPRSVAILRALGNLEMEAQKYDATIEAFHAALILSPGDRDLPIQLATVYLKSNDSQAALWELGKVLMRDSGNGAARFLRAQIYTDMGENGKAREDAEKVVFARPDYLPARVLYAKVLVRLRECARAVEILRPAGNSPELDVGGLFILAGAYDCAGRKEEARDMSARFETASRAEHENSENRVQSLHLVEQANALALQNKLADAQELLRQALEKDPQNGFAYSQQAKIYFSMHQQEQAREAIATALKLQPYQPDFLFVMGVIDAQSGDLDAALSAFRAVTYVNPQEADAYFEIGKIWMLKRDRPQALEAFRKAAELSPQDEEYKRALRSAAQAER